MLLYFLAQLVPALVTGSFLAGSCVSLPPSPTHPFVHGWVYVCRMFYILLQAHLTCLLFQTENQHFSEELRLLSLARIIIRNQGGLPW